LKLNQSQNDKSKFCEDAHGYHCNIKYLRYLASAFPDSVLLVSRDKKAKIPTKGPAVSKSFKRVHQTALTTEQRDELIQKGTSFTATSFFFHQLGLVVLDDDVEIHVTEFLATPKDDHQFEFGDYTIVPNVLLLCSVDQSLAIHQNRAACTLRSSQDPLGPAETTKDLEDFIGLNCLHSLTSYENADGSDGTSFIIHELDSLFIFREKAAVDNLNR
jgi:hypothetical protein